MKVCDTGAILMIAPVPHLRNPGCDMPSCKPIGTSSNCDSQIASQKDGALPFPAPLNRFTALL